MENNLPEIPPIQKPARPWDMLDPNVGRVSEEVQKSRMEICSTCPYLFKLSKQCRKCGCLMNLKTQLPHASCPINKWGTAPAVEE
jgi:hypothetical protein